MAENKVNLSWEEVGERSAQLAQQILGIVSRRPVYLYGVPRGGVHASLLVAQALAFHRVGTVQVTDPDQADVLVDDIIDTGSTRSQFINRCGTPFVALVDKQSASDKCLGWVVFPWEKTDEAAGPEENVRRLIEFLGDDPQREGLRETPTRVLRSYERLFGGYHQDPQQVMKTFQSQECDEIVLLKNVEFYSTCEHHMLPFYGRAHVAYIPDGRLLGISKLARLVEIYSRRLQIQERLCAEITTCLMNILHPRGAACVMEAQHLCMISRGVEKQNSIMVTSSLQGVFREDARTRNEFMTMIARS